MISTCHVGNNIVMITFTVEVVWSIKALIAKYIVFYLYLLVCMSTFPPGDIKNIIKSVHFIMPYHYINLLSHGFFHVSLLHIGPRTLGDTWHTMWFIHTYIYIVRLYVVYLTCKVPWSPQSEITFCLTILICRETLMHSLISNIIADMPLVRCIS